MFYPLSCGDLHCKLTIAKCKFQIVRTVTQFSFCNLNFGNTLAV
jgi:hypothetical protein